MRLGLRGEILIAFALVTLFAIGLNTMVVLQLEGLVERHERLQDSETFARLVAAQLGPSPAPGALQSALSAAPDVFAAEVVGTGGEVRDRMGQPPSPAEKLDIGTRARLLGRAGALALGTDPGGAKVVAAAAPLSIGQPSAVVLLWRRAGEGDAGAPQRHLIILYVALNALMAGGFGWYLIARVVMRPVRRLADATRRVAQGERSLRVPAGAPDELGALAADFNRMIESLSEKEGELSRQLGELRAANEQLRSAREEVVQSAKLASVGRLAAGVAHELGNPVGAVTGYVSALLRGRMEEKSEDADMLRRIEREMKRVDRIIRDLLDYARPRPQDTKAIDLDQTADAAVAIVSVQKAFQTITLKRLRGSPSQVRGDPHRLQQVIVNLLINAADAMEGAPERQLVIETFAGEFPAVPRGRRSQDLPPPSGPAAGIRVSDTGSGIDPAHLPMLFDPFFTTKEPGRGTGLGLAISRTIVESFGGRILVESEKGKGTTFTVLLPPADAAVDAQPSQQNTE